MKLFHVTLKSSLDSILQEGLLPRRGPRSSQLGEIDEAVYCFASKEDCENALMNWLGEAFDDDEELVVLEINFEPAISRSDAAYEIAILEPIPGNCIEQVHDADFFCSSESSGFDCSVN